MSSVSQSEQSQTPKMASSHSDETTNKAIQTITNDGNTTHFVIDTKDGCYVVTQNPEGDGDGLCVYFVGNNEGKDGDDDYDICCCLSYTNPIWVNRVRHPAQIVMCHKGTKVFKPITTSVEVTEEFIQEVINYVHKCMQSPIEGQASSELLNDAIREFTEGCKREVDM